MDIINIIGAKTGKEQNACLKTKLAYFGEAMFEAMFSDRHSLHEICLFTCRQALSLTLSHGRGNKRPVLIAFQTGLMLAAQTKPNI